MHELYWKCFHFLYLISKIGKYQTKSNMQGEPIWYVMDFYNSIQIFDCRFLFIFIMRQKLRPSVCKSIELWPGKQIICDTNIVLEEFYWDRWFNQHFNNSFKQIKVKMLLFKTSPVMPKTLLKRQMSGCYKGHKSNVNLTRYITSRRGPIGWNDNVLSTSLPHGI